MSIAEREYDVVSASDIIDDIEDECDTTNRFSRKTIEDSATVGSCFSGITVTSSKIDRLAKTADSMKDNEAAKAVGQKVALTTAEEDWSFDPHCSSDTTNQNSSKPVFYFERIIEHQMRKFRAEKGGTAEKNAYVPPGFDVLTTELDHVKLQLNRARSDNIDIMSERDELKRMYADMKSDFDHYEATVASQLDKHIMKENIIRLLRRLDYFSNEDNVLVSISNIARCLELARGIEVVNSPKVFAEIEKRLLDCLWASHDANMDAFTWLKIHALVEDSYNSDRFLESQKADKAVEYAAVDVDVERNV